MIHDSHRDRIWFGTRHSGLISFDGTRFTQYDSSNSGLPSNFVRALAFDRWNRLWIGTNDSGAIRFDMDRNKWELRYNTSNGLARNTVRGIAVDAVGYVWLGTFGGGIIKLAPDGVIDDTLTVSNSQGKLLTDFIHSLAADSTGNLWIGTSKGISMLDNEGTWGMSYPVGRVLSLLVDQKDCKWFGTESFINSGIYKLSRRQGVWELKVIEVPCFANSDPAAGNYIYAITRDPDGHLWFGTGNSALMFDPVNEAWRCRTGDADFDRKQVQTIAADEDGDLWFGSLGPPGATKHKANWVSFAKANDDSLKKLNSDVIHAMTLDSVGQIWIGTDRGVARFDSSRWKPKTFFPDDSTLQANTINAVAVENNGTLWIGTFGQGVFLVNSKGDTIKHFTTQNTGGGLISDFIFAIALTPEFAWVGTKDGLNRYHFRSARWNTFTASSTNGGLLSDEIHALAVDKEGRLWCGTALGASSYDGAWKSYTPANTGDRLGNGGVLAITVDQQSGRVWFGTAGGGASRFINDAWENRLTINDGLADNFVQDIELLNEENQVWFATAGGVSCLDRAGDWITYTVADGLIDNDVTTLQSGKRKGELWFGSRADGVTRYRKQKQPPNTSILTQIEVTTQSELVFDFVGNDLNTSKAQLRYSYKLDASEWSEPSFNDFAQIPILKNGWHTFYVKAIDQDKNEDPSPASDAFYKIHPDTGQITIETDYKVFGLDSVRVVLYWPPYQFSSDQILSLAIEPADTTTLNKNAILAYDFKPSSIDLKQKGVILTFEFPASPDAAQTDFAIYHELDAFGQATGARLGGTPQRIASSRLSLATHIEQLGRYSVRHEVNASSNFIYDKEEETRVTPRLFSPLAGGHGQQTALSFPLHESAHVRISVFNLAGRLMKVVKDEFMLAGRQAVTWDGRDREGRICPSGLYLMVLESAGFKSPQPPQKVMLLNETSPR